jgi:TDG/mug DNA glycosylase family protein
VLPPLQGSLDSNLRSIVPNDFLPLFDSHPSIRVVASNGGTSARLFKKHFPQDELKARGIRFLQLPSSSPAHAMKDAVTQKSNKWRELLRIDESGNWL